MFKQALVLFCAFTTAAFTADWPGYRGPNGDGSTSEKILTDWSTKKPKELWRTPTGEGFGTCAVAGNRVYCIALRKDTDFCVCLDAATGKELWATPCGRSILNEHQGGDGPRSTPTLDGGKIYVLSTFLTLSCLDAGGKVLWAHDLEKAYGGTFQTTQNGSIQKWGNAQSPVVDGNLVFVHGGGASQAFLAFNKNDGKLAWKGEDDKMTHSTPVVATIQGVRQVIFFSTKGLASLKTDNGQLLWRFPFKFNVSTAIAPVVSGDIVYCSAGYGVGGGACKISKQGDGLTATELWKTPGANINHWSTPTVKDGYLYGLFGFKEYHTEPLKCVELATGKEMWSQKGFGQGGSILVGDSILTLGEDGQLVICEASPKGYKETGKIEPLKYKCWNNPVVADGKIYARSTKEIVCLDAAAK